MQCEIAKRFFDMMAAIAAEQKVPREYGGGFMLYRAEMELLEKIDEYPVSNVSALSKMSGVTKSAVTQMTVRLLEKGLIERYQSPQNKKEKYFRLTETGRTARQRHEESNQTAAEKLRNYLCSLSSDEKKVILEFMDMMKKYMPVCAFPCQHGLEGTGCFLTEEERGMEDKCWN